MAEGFGSAGANTALDAMCAAYTWIKLHTAAPGAAGDDRGGDGNDPQAGDMGRG